MNIADLKTKLKEVVKKELVEVEHSRVAADLLTGLEDLLERVIQAELQRVLTPAGVDSQGRPVAAVVRDPNLVEHPADVEPEPEPVVVEDEPGRHEAGSDDSGL
jgi:hypothetical protein